jgi:hypothetical protein
LQFVQQRELSTREIARIFGYAPGYARHGHSRHTWHT